MYWATDNILDDSVQLPDVHPQHIISSRLIKQVLTGDLNGTINSNPPFPGKERHFLRALIARISHACTIVPAGLYGESEDENATEPVV